MTTKTAARTAALIPVPIPAKTEIAKEAPGGWDPYEVWRTRVLLPRLEPRAAQSTDRPKPISALVKR